MGELMLKKPLEERLYFDNLEPDWLKLVIDRGLPAGWWEVEGKRLVPTGAMREKSGGRYAESAFFRFTVYLREVWDAEGHAQMWIPKQNEYGEVVDMGEPVMMFDAEREPSRWLVSAVCFFEYAVETFNRLVEQLRAAGGVEPQQRVESKRPKGKMSDERTRRAEIFITLHEQFPKLSQSKLALKALELYPDVLEGWATISGDTVKHDFEAMGVKWGREK